jgi:hypothetical protein
MVLQRQQLLQQVGRSLVVVNDQHIHSTPPEHFFEGMSIDGPTGGKL